ncbi:hypothetical protein CRV24_002192 [Beauveria bassiana]|nr:hypothetical protein CRV24_002192 [Beauveria bassiana]
MVQIPTAQQCARTNSKWPENIERAVQPCQPSPLFQTWGNLRQFWDNSPRYWLHHQPPRPARITGDWTCSSKTQAKLEPISWKIDPHAARYGLAQHSTCWSRSGKLYACNRCAYMCFYYDVF